MGVSAISKEQLIEYIKKAMDMEMGRQYIVEMHSDVQRKIWGLEGNYNEVSRRQYTYPQKPVMPVRPEIREYDHEDRKISKKTIIISVIVAICAIRIYMTLNTGIGALLIPFLGVIAFFALIYIIPVAIVELNDKSAQKKYRKDCVDTENSNRIKAYCYERDMYPKRLEEYNKKCREIETAIENDKRSLRNLSDNIAQMKIIEQTIVDKLNEAKEQLKTFYSVNIIHEKYRGLNPMCKFYEYLDSGRCDTLKEAMNTYEKEVFQDELGSKLDNLTGAVNSVKYEIAYLGNRMEYLIDGISDSFAAVNRNIDAMNSRLDTQTYYAQISSECNKQIANNLDTIRFYEDMKWIDYQRNNY